MKSCLNTDVDEKSILQSEKKEKKYALICCEHIVSAEHPNAIRMAMLGRILQELDYEVAMLGVNSKYEKSGEHELIPYQNICVGSCTKLSDRFRTRKKLIKDIDNYLGTRQNPHIIIIASYVGVFESVIRKYAQKNKAIIIQSVCEWFDKQVFLGKLNFLGLLRNRYSLRVMNVHVGKIIAISTLLESYYKKHKCECIRIPTVLDTTKWIAPHYNSDDLLRLVYAGTPGKKDYLGNAIIGLALLPKTVRKKIRLDLYGVNMGDLISILGISRKVVDDIGESLIVHNRIPFEKIPEEIRKADFSILLRPNKRYANAGFPTKVGESMAAGVPVIANLTSDLSMYIKDGQTGLVVKDESPEAFSSAVYRALSLTPKEKYQMKLNARNMAEKCFDYREYIETFRQFLGMCGIAR
ncbi:MAG TPA: hypothetical protein DC024_09830 [Clostridiales bacterium]|jgi:glycosyltransferase involved in cell wall biosynthesis|nr:hypothetical protein [Clostridiales bacterium]